MRILFLSDNFPPESNAPATRLFEHAVRWVSAGHQVTVITCAPNFPEGRIYPGYVNRWRKVEQMEGIRVVRVKTFIAENKGVLRRTLDYLSFMVCGFVMGILERRPDVVVATSPQFFCALGGWALALVKRRPFVFELRDLWPAEIVAVGVIRNRLIIRVLERLELFLYRRAAAVVPVTESFRENLVSRGIERHKIHVVTNGVDLNRCVPRPRDDELAHRLGLYGKFVAGYIGTHGLTHALPKVLAAAEQLRDRRDIGFFFVGAGAERQHVESIVREHRLNNVSLISRQPKDQMPAFWSLCDIAIVPLRDEPLFTTVIPSKIFEAMGMGVPVLASLPEGEATAIVRRTGAGLCVPPEDSTAMARTLVQLADQPALVSRLREKAQASAILFSRDVLARQMLHIFQELGG